MVHAGEVVAERFEILGLAGSGGMGSVYRARDLHAGAPVALKLLGIIDEDAEQRFSREARVLAELGHPAIVGYVAHGVLPLGVRWLAMEWLDGEDLARRLTRGPLAVGEALALARRVAAALAVAHRRGIVHRDIKPSNLMLVGGRIDAVKLIDFGVARLARRASDVTRTGDRVGTLRFMAPEQASGAPDVDARADVYALGCVLYLCLTGRPPFSGEDPTDPVTPGPGTAGLPPPSRLARVPPAVDALVLRMLARAREERPADGGALVEEIVRLSELDETRRIGLEATLGGGERRLVSVVVSARPRAELGALAERAGGTLDLTADGAGVVTLGGYGEATDRAAHAARVALAVQALATDAAVGLATGWAYVGAASPMGEAVDRALALARSAPAGVWIDDVTAGLLDNRFQLAGAAAQLELRGELRGDGVRRLLGRQTPFVGRERELTTLEAAFTASCDGQATAMLVSGPAGAGKSRLRYELLARIGDRALVLMGRGDPLRAGSPFGLLAAAMREATGILDDEPIEVARRRLRDRVGEVVPAADAARVTEFLGELVAVPFPAEDRVHLRAARDDRALMGDQIRLAWEDFLRALCARGPVVLVLEDLHWGDIPSVQLVDRALSHLADLPLLVVALARPEVHDLFPRLWAGRGMTEIALPPLSRRAGERLVTQVLGPRATPDVVEAITERAGGNAFFLEELIRAVAESSGDMPRTLVAMVLARVEALPAEARRVLRAASVFGDVFWRSGVAALAGEEARDWVRVLAERELVGRRASRRLQTEEEFVFRHALVREAAYGTLTDDDRRAGHRAAGLWLESAGERDSTVLAHHFERGGEPARALVHYTRAAEQALEGSDLEAVLRLVGCGVTCGAAGPALGRLRLLEAQARAWRTEFAAAIEAAREAARLSAPGTPQWLGAVAEAAIACARMGRLADAFALADELRASATPDAAGHRALARVAANLALVGAGDRVQRLLELTPAPEACADPQLAAFLHRAGGACRAGNEHPAAIPALERAVECFLAAGDLRSATLDRANIGLILTRIGAWDRAEDLLREVLVTATRLGLTMVQTDARFAIAEALAGRGDLGEAAALYADVIARYVGNGARRMEASARCGLARLLVRRERRAEAVEEARLAVAATATMPPAHAYALATLAHAARRGDAVGAARAAWAAFQQGGAAEEEVWTLATVAQALAGEDAATAAAAAEAGRARARSWLELLGGDLRAALMRREEVVWLLREA